MSEKQGWTAGPRGRGSLDILWTCLSTLALCVWTAVHPNILCVPSYRRALFSRLGMMLLAIVFPEIIISAAWRQIKLAQWLRAEVNAFYSDTSLKPQIQSGEVDYSITSDDQELQRIMLPPFEFERDLEHARLQLRDASQSVTSLSGETLKPSGGKGDQESKKPVQWNSTQAFFVVMGGFAIEIDYFNNIKDTKVTLRRLVTAEGVLQLIKLGLTPPISPEEIEERSKADIIAKTFVLSQIIWFGLQVIGRLASEIPVSLLEVHTAIHVACTIAIYFMWLKKPYDLRSSIRLSEPGAKDMGALFYFSRVKAEVYAQIYAKFENNRADYWRNRAVLAASNLLNHDPPPTPPTKEALITSIERYSMMNFDELENTNDLNESTLVALAPSALRGIEILRIQEGLTNDHINSQNWNFLRESSENFTIREVWGSWTANTGHEMSLDKGLHFLFNLLYGGGHLAAWSSAFFPTRMEQWLWRVSAIILTFVPFWGVLWILWWKAASSKRRELSIFRSGDLDIIGAPFFIVIIVTYFLARSYLLIESLVSLRLLPDGALLTVNWAQFLPHIS